MAEATTQITVTPKQLGKHLRSIRRKKGLSLSEVARGAGLSRRELVNYERGKLPIPENDLWVLAGSCGVDVSELMPTTSSMELTVAANATSVGDTVSQLRRSQADAGVTSYLHTLQKLQALPAGKRIPVKERELEEIATALGSTPRSIEQKLQEVLNVSPDEAERLRAMILVPPNTRGRQRALGAAPSVTAAAEAAAAAAAAAAAIPAPALAPAPAPLPTPVVEAPPIAAVPTPTPFVADPAPPAPLAPVADAAAFAEPEAPVEPEAVQTFPVAPAAFLDQPLDAPIDALQGHNVDVFEELARLPEPLPLADPSEPVPDLLAPQDPFENPFVGVPAIGPPEGAVELVDSAMPATAANGTAITGTASWNAADAPPIDVAMRQGSATWDLGEPPLVAKVPPAADPTTWDTNGWQPPAPDGTGGAPGGFWEGTDDWTPPTDGPASTTFTDGVEAPAERIVIDEGTWAGAAWDPEPWSPVEAAADTVVDVNPWSTEEWPREPADLGAWDHRPDPAAVDTGFYVDWGTSETEAPPGWDVFTEPPATDIDDIDDIEANAANAATEADREPEPADAPAAWDNWEQTSSVETSDVDALLADDDPSTSALDEQGSAAPIVESPAFDTAAFGALVVDPPTFDPPTFDPPAFDSPAFESPAFESPAFDTASLEIAATTETAVEDPAPTSMELVPILWRADAEAEPTIDAAAEPAPEPAPTPALGDFVVAGPDWQLGNALPLVEVQSQGGLVMRRADERWALADVTTGADFVAEFEVDFRSGPGLGVLFRASIDDAGRMSGYSFDIDPIYDGGGYLVRQWQSDRELWNPIARVGGDDPTSMYGKLLVRIEVVGDHLSAQVNGVEVLTVEDLQHASAERGRDAATGDRVGVQAWSSSDLVIDTVRVAAR